MKEYKDWNRVIFGGQDVGGTPADHRVGDKFKCVIPERMRMYFFKVTEVQEKKLIVEEVK